MPEKNNTPKVGESLRADKTENVAGVKTESGQANVHLIVPKSQGAWAMNANVPLKPKFILSKCAGMLVSGESKW